MAKQKYWNGSAWTAIGTDASKVEIVDSGGIITATNVESALQETSIKIGNLETDYTKLVPYGGTTTGSANAYTIATPTITALTVGMAVTIKIHAASSAASTLNWDGKGIKSIKKANGTAVTNLALNGMYTLRYDGTNFVLQGEGASGNAIASDLLSGKTASTDVGDIVGTMPTKALATITPSGSVQTIAAGQYLGGVQTISAVTVPVGNVLSGTTIAGQTGTIPSKSTATYTPSTSNQTISVGQYLSGTQTISGDGDLISANIVQNKNIFNVAGKSGVVDTTDASVAAGDILVGHSGYDNGVKITGSMVDRAGDTASTASAVSGTTLRLRASVGFRDGSNDYVTLADADFISANIKSGKNVFGLTGTMPTAPTHGSQSYIIAGTYNFTVPSNVTQITVIVIGAGGGGGGGFQCYAGGGGGGGSWIGTINTIQGAVLGVTVGASGTGGIYTGAGGDGGGSIASGFAGGGGGGGGCSNSYGGVGGSAGGVGVSASGTGGDGYAGGDGSAGGDGYSDAGRGGYGGRGIDGSDGSAGKVVITW